MIFDRIFEALWTFVYFRDFSTPNLWVIVAMTPDVGSGRHWNNVPEVEYFRDSNNNVYKKGLFACPQYAIEGFNFCNDFV